MKIKDLQDLAFRLHSLDTNGSKITEICIKPTYEAFKELEKDLNDFSLGWYIQSKTEANSEDIIAMVGGITFIIRKP